MQKIVNVILIHATAFVSANEVNTQNFDIERSLDGVNFEKIGEVSAKNTSGEHRYEFIDKDLPNQSILYYRLKQNEFNHEGGVRENIRLVKQ